MEERRRRTDAHIAQMRQLQQFYSQAQRLEREIVTKSKWYRLYTGC